MECEDMPMITQDNLTKKVKKEQPMDIEHNINGMSRMSEQDNIFQPNSIKNENTTNSSID